jgi:predicted alpha-1,6-mannanase (GH76 family)
MEGRRLELADWSASVDVDSSELILQKIKSAAIGLTDNLSVHEYFQGIRFEVAYASHSF